METRNARPKIVLRSSWQTVNIGDIGHTPGVLALLEKHIPEADVRLWPSSVGDGVKEMLQKRFPKLEFVLTDADRTRALSECDFFLHGSGPSLVAETDLSRWASETKKPYGIYGITLPSYPRGTVESVVATANQKTLDLISGASFAFFRDSVSLAVARARGVSAKVCEFAPDGAFAADIVDEPAARRFLRANDLSRGRFVCCIPRFRFTPYWKIHPERPRDPVRAARNDAMKEHDHAPLRDAIAAVVRETGKRVLICPEDKSQMEIGKEMLYDRLPDDIKAKTVWRETFWRTDEALGVYKQSAGLFGLEMHSPILCVGNEIPAIVGRFSEQTSKGFMWRDIELSDWLFDFDSPADLSRFVPTVVEMARGGRKVRERVSGARSRVRARQTETMAVLRDVLGLPRTA